MNLYYYFSSRHVRKNTLHFLVVVLDNLTDLCLIYDFGKPSKSLVPDQTDGWHKYMHRVKGIDFLMGYAVTCSSSHAAWVHEFLSGKLQVCKVPGGDPAFIRIRTCFFFNTFLTYLCIFHSVLNLLTRLYKVRTWPITWYFETGVRQS